MDDRVTGPWAAGGIVLGASIRDRGDFGVDAAPGVSDLGGTSHHESSNPLQCRDVFGR